MIKTPEQLKGAIRNLAKEKGIHAGKCRLEPSKTGGSCHSKEKRFPIRSTEHRTDSAGVEKINRSAGFMETVSGTKFICKRNYISCNHGNNKYIYREDEFLIAREINKIENKDMAITLLWNKSKSQTFAWLIPVILSYHFIENNLLTPSLG